MACATIHLAIAKNYLDKHKELDYEKVMAGSLYPDAAEVIMLVMYVAR